MTGNYFVPCPDLPEYSKWTHYQLAEACRCYHVRMVEQQDEIQRLRNQLATAQKALARNGDDWR